MDQSAIEQIAGLARIDLEESSKARLTAELSAILEYFNRLGEVETEGVLPSTSAVDLSGRLRPDQPQAPFPRDRLMANTTCEQERCFRVPRVIE